jgi:hypothetical protein
MMVEVKVLARLVEANTYFRDSSYDSVLDSANGHYHNGRFLECVAQLDKLPTVDALLHALIEKLKGKSVYDTLKRICEGKAQEYMVVAKGFSSLLTHTLIEIEHGNLEYRRLIPVIMEQLSEVSHAVLSVNTRIDRTNDLVNARIDKG